LPHTINLNGIDMRKLNAQEARVANDFWE